MEMTPSRWAYTNAYLRDVFGKEDDALERLAKEAIASALPSISITADVGRLLRLLVSATRAERAIEVGTLGGYSALWIARALKDSGRLITIEIDPKHAAFARRQFANAGMSDRVDLREGAALDVLCALAKDLSPDSVDFVFLDGVKREYSEYFRIVRPLVRVGGILVADNALGAGSWWIDDEASADRKAMDDFNRTVAADRAFDSACVPIREGLVIARRIDPR